MQIIKFNVFFFFFCRLPHIVSVLCQATSNEHTLKIKKTIQGYRSNKLVVISGK